MKYQIKCIKCSRIELESIIYCSNCSGDLEIDYLNYPKISEKFSYRNFSPLSLKEINNYPNKSTPLKKIGNNIYAKLEYFNLSGSAKDREAYIEIYMAKKLGYDGIIAATTGNMGASLANLCSKIKFQCLILTPSDTSKSKVEQIEKYGVKVIKIKGKYDLVAQKARILANEKNLFLASLQAFRFEGYKTISYEIFEELANKMPKNIIIPMGDGTTFVSIWKGFNDLFKLGLINEIPSFIGVQAKNSDPIKMAFQSGKKINPIKNPQSIAKAIRIGNPLDGDYAIKIVNNTKGNILSYSDEQIISAYKKLLNFGIDAEYASAVTYCPILFNKVKNALIVITGPGYKN